MIWWVEEQDGLIYVGLKKFQIEKFQKILQIVIDSTNRLPFTH